MEAADRVLTEAQARALSQLAEATLAASTEVLSDLVLHRVIAGSPTLSVTRWDELAARWSGPLIIVRVEYVAGVQGSNLLVMSAKDARVIAALMMGETPDAASADAALDELHLSAVAEAMNQMMGSAATSLSELLGRRINISPPVTELREAFDSKGLDLPPALAAGNGDAVVVLSFPLRIEDDLSVAIESHVVQVFPAGFARRLADEYLAPGSGEGTAGRAAAGAGAAGPAAAPQAASQAAASRSATGPAGAGRAASPQAAFLQTAPPQPTSARLGQPPQAPPAPAPRAAARQPHPPAPSAAASSWQPPELDMSDADEEDRVPLEVIKQITVPVTVRLGQAHLPLEEVLRLSRGSIVPLDVSDGQPVEVLVSGTLIARGEVVVVREHFGVRITELVRPAATPD